MELHTDRMKLAEVFPDAAKSWAKRLHIKADAIDYVRKGIPIDPADISIEDGERAAIRLISTPHLDRDMEILIPSGAIMDDFRKNPVVLYAHDYSGLPIGKDLWIKPTNKGILAKTAYATHQFAEDVYGCVKGGFLNTSSAGFIPVEVVANGEKGFDAWQAVLEKDYGITRGESGQAKRMYTKWALLEHSDVPVPSNAESLNLLVGKGISARLKRDMGVPEPGADIPVDNGAGDPVVFPEKAVDKEGDISAGMSEPVETFTGPEFSAPVETAPAPETKDAPPVADAPAAFSPDVNLQTMSAILDTLRGIKDTLDRKAQGDEVQGEANDSVPSMVFDLLRKMDTLIESVDGLREDMAEAQAAWLAQRPVAVEEPAPMSVVPVEPPPPMPVAKDDPAPEPPAPDVRAIVAEAMKSLDVKAISEQAAALALAKLRGKVTVG